MRSQMPGKQRLLCLCIGLTLGALLILALCNNKP